MVEYDLLSNPVMFMINAITLYITGDARLTGILILLVALIFCLINRFDIQLSLIIFNPLLIALVANSFLPQISLMLILAVSASLWIGIFAYLFNVQLNK
jgi:hypothetical protein